MEAYWPPAAELRVSLLRLAGLMHAYGIAEFRFRVAGLNGAVTSGKGGKAVADLCHETEAQGHYALLEHRRTLTCCEDVNSIPSCRSPVASEKSSPGLVGRGSDGVLCHPQADLVAPTSLEGHPRTRPWGAPEGPKRNTLYPEADEADCQSRFPLKENRTRKRLFLLRSPEVGVWKNNCRAETAQETEEGTVLGRIVSLEGDDTVRAPGRGRPAFLLAREGDPVGAGQPLVLWEVAE
jgi:hypothetical protein